MKKKIKLLIVFIFFLVLIICSLVKIKKTNNLENRLIFNLYENSNNTVKFNVRNNSNQTKSIDLYNTIVGEANFNKKVAPGIKGEFEIEILSTSDVKYKILFKSKTQKPKNLIFKIKNSIKKYNSLEEIEKALKGTTKRGKRTKYKIEWSWEYETTSTNNLQDTLDGENIDKYIFDIIVLSSQI